MAKRGRSVAHLASTTAEILAELLQRQVDQLSSDDIPLSINARPAAIHFIEALQYGLPEGNPPVLRKLTEAEYAVHFPDHWTTLMREFNLSYVDPRTQSPAPPEPRRRSRLL